MIKKPIVSLVTVSLLMTQTNVAWAACDMTFLKAHTDPAHTRVYQAAQGEPAVYFRANLDVNTDGNSRSYHPADPLGRSLALNNMGNGMTGIWDARGQRIDCEPRQGACFMRWINTFTAARDAGYDPNGHPRIETYNIIPWRLDEGLGRRVPCTIGSGPYRGYFVSQTAFIVDSSRPECDQDRYLDSLAFNAAVLPKRTIWLSQGRQVAVGDLVVVDAPALGRTRYAIIGDTGPQNGIGEGTIALAAALRDTQVSPTATYAEVKALEIGDARYLIFPGTDIRARLRGRVTQADIDREGAALFGRWGGSTRLQQCAGLPRR